MIRIPDARRETVLKAAECGPDIIDLPMVNSPEEIRRLCTFAKFPPLGQRGFFSVLRSIHYGLVESIPDEQQVLNEDLSLLVQVETAEAVERIDEFCAVPGVDIFIRPGTFLPTSGCRGILPIPKLLPRCATRWRPHGVTTVAWQRRPAKRMLPSGSIWAWTCSSVQTISFASEPGRRLPSSTPRH